MNTLEIIIQRSTENGWPIVIEHSISSENLVVRNEGLLQLDRTELLKQITPKAYGALLGQALFRDNVRDTFVRALAENDKTLRVLLSVEAPELKVLRWERLCAPFDGQWDFLALNQRVPFSLYLPSQTDRRFPPFGRRDLRALVVVASPNGMEQYGLDPFDEHAAIASVCTALGDIPADVLSTTQDAIGLPTLDELCARITAERYNLLHIVCHGRYLADQGESVLYLSTPERQVDAVSSTRLIERLARLHGTHGLPHLAFLATCESARPDAEGALGGLGQRLVRELGMPAVVAMTERVTIATAQALAENFYRQLRVHGEVDRALAEATAGLAERYDVTVPALYSRLGERPLFSDTLDRPLTSAEIEFGLTQLANVLDDRAPILCEQFEPAAQTLRGMLHADPAALSETAKHDREQALKQVEQICVEAVDLGFGALALGQTPPAYDARCPFRGLYPFRAEDREFFFGRERLIENLQEKLAHHNLLAVLGSSGCGKSSLVLAGLIPALEKLEPGLQMAYLTPNNDPVGQLETALSHTNSEHRIIVVDQFEELFTLTTDEQKRRAFLERLLTLIKTERVVLTMRADFWGECAPYPTLKDEMQAHQELVAPMNAAELRRAMESQAKKVDLRFEADVANTLLDDVQNEPGAMPLLQHALLELWKRRHGRWLRASEYRVIGGVAQAIAYTADEVFKQLSPAEQTAVQNIFVRLTRLDEQAVRGEERRDTRRRVGQEELVPAGSDPGTTINLVNRLADKRLIVTSVNAVTGRKEVEVAHEALIRYWHRLRQWLDIDLTNLRLRENIRDAAQEWQDSNHDEGLLWRGKRLHDAAELMRQPLASLNALEQEFVTASITLEDRERNEELEQQRRELDAERKARIRISILALLALLLAGSAGLFWNQASQAAGENEILAIKNAQVAQTAQAASTRAVEQATVAANAAADAIAQQNRAIAEANRANEQARISEARRITAHSVSNRGKFDRSLLLGVQAAHINENADVRGNLLDAIESQPPLIRYLHEHQNLVVSVTFSPDGKTLASGSADKTIILWDISTALNTDSATRQPIGQPLTGHTSGVSSVAFSPDGKTLASGSVDKTIILWDVATRQRIGQPLTGHTNSVWSVAFSPDGKTFASGSFDKTIILWDVATRQRIGQPLTEHTNSVWSVAFSPDGKTLASGSADKTIILWDVATRQPIGQPLTGHTNSVWSVAFSDDGKMLASGSDDKTITLWDVGTRQRIGQPLTGHTSGVSSVAFYPDSKTLILVSRGWDGTIILWDVATRQRNGQLLTGSGVSSFAFSPDGKVLASGSEEIMLWNMTTRQFLGKSLLGHRSEVWSVAFSDDGKMLASGNNDKTITLWDVGTRKRIGQPLTGHTNLMSSVAFNPNGKTLASGSCGHLTTVSVCDRGEIILWDISTALNTGSATGQSIGQPLTGHTSDVSSVAFSPDGKTLASGSFDKTIILWDVGTRQPIGQPLTGHTSEVWSVAFSPDGKTFASGSADKTIILWDVGTRQPIGQPLTGHTSDVRSVAFGPDGKTLASGSRDKTIILWDVVTRQRIGQPLTGHTSEVWSVAFSPDGKTFASGSVDRTIILWDVATRQRIGQPLTGHTSEVRSVAFSPDGKTLASGSYDKTIILWDVDLESWKTRACFIANRNLTRAEWTQYINSDPSTYDTIYARNPTCPGLPVELSPTPTPTPTPRP